MKSTDKSITPEYIDVGSWIHFDKEAADNLNIIYTHVSQDDYHAVPGFYYVTEVDTSYVNDPNAPSHARVAMTFFARHVEWNEGDGHLDIPITINPDGAIILPGEILIGNAIFQVSNPTMTLKELIKTNSKRYACARCSQPLNVVGITTRICVSCEKELE